MSANKISEVPLKINPLQIIKAQHHYDNGVIGFQIQAVGYDDSEPNVIIDVNLLPLDENHRPVATRIIFPLPSLEGFKILLDKFEASMDGVPQSEPMLKKGYLN